MFRNYRLKKFCKEFTEIKGHSAQAVIIMAVVEGIKPVMDDWIRVDRYDEYRKICKKYGLFIKPDTIFNIVKTDDIPLDVVGREHLNTTKAFGLPFCSREARENNTVHVFISKSKKNLEKCFNDGWYPLIIKKRVINKPLIDNFRFGYQLGYPKCCVDFFQRYNNWCKYSYLYEVLKNTPKGQYNYLCNPFTKDITYSYIYHMPCSYNCKATIELAGKIRAVIVKKEPEFAKEIDKRLNMPFLVFCEKKFYAFDGRVNNNRIYYKNVYFVDTSPENNIYENVLKMGNCVFLEDKDLVILNNGKLIKKVKWQKKNFAPEIPFIIQFNNHIRKR